MITFKNNYKYDVCIEEWFIQRTQIFCILSTGISGIQELNLLSFHKFHEGSCNGFVYQILKESVTQQYSLNEEGKLSIDIF